MKTILLIEDDFSIRKMIRDFLELQNFSVITSENGLIGLELAQKIIPDLIISDIMMPVMDGYNLKQKLSNNPVTATIPFIFLTSKADRKNIRKGMELGADDYLFKPFNMDELAASIETQLEKRGLLLIKFSKSNENKTKTDYKYNEHVLLKIHGNPSFVLINSIVYILADEKYTKVFLSSNEKLLISKSLKDWEELLPSSNFIRIHRSTIVNINFIQKVDKWFQRSYKVKLKNIDEPLFISRRYYSKLRELF